MDGLFRRGGVWYARLVIPDQLRPVLQKREFVASTGVREPVLARVVAAELLAGWRRRLHDLSRIAAGCMDIERISAGNPALLGGGYMGLEEAARASGIDQSRLVDGAAIGAVRLFYRAVRLPGHLIGAEEFELVRGASDTEIIIPSPDQLSNLAVPSDFVGVLRLRDPRGCAQICGNGGTHTVVLFDLLDVPDQFFAPSAPVQIATGDLLLSVSEVDTLRRTLAAGITPEALALAQSERQAATSIGKPSAHGSKKTSEAVAAFMVPRSINCSPDQARRIRAALDLFVELESDPRLDQLDDARLEAFRDEHLPLVPANENKVRLQRGTTSITESIKAVEGSDWPRLSASEQVKRLAWLQEFVRWLKTKNWIERDPSLSLVKESVAKATRKKQAERAQDSRQMFSREDLQKIFSFGSWFRTGRGELTKQGTYREFSTYYYWLPLLGLFTGARINELSQLFLKDIQQSHAGTWFLTIAVLDDENSSKRRKNANATRSVPLHPLLIELGFVTWCSELRRAGYKRLFPELTFDQVKGYGKAPTRRFSDYLKRLGWERDGTKVFHSFRSTLVTECITRLGLTHYEVAQISGHSEAKSVLQNHYVKDAQPDKLAPLVARLDFDLPPISPFDCAAGLLAIKDALGRKDRGRGGKEDLGSSTN